MASLGQAPAKTHLCPPDPPDPRLLTKPSFAAIIRSKQSGAEVKKTIYERRFPLIQLPARQYGTKDGKPSISFTAAEQQAGIDNLKHSLVVKFSGGRPPIEAVRTAFLEAWKVSGACSIGAWDARHILVVLESEVDARLVLSHPMRKLGHSLFRIFRWSVDFDIKKEPSTTTTWVRMANLPPQMYNQGYIEPIINSFGRFLALDNKTVSFNNPSFARVCIEVDVSNPLPEEVWIATGPQSGFWLKLIYENRLFFCTKCRLHGHLLESCRKVKQRREEESKIWEARDENGLPTGKPTASFAQSAQLQPQPQRTVNMVQSDRLDVPLTEHASRPSASEKHVQSLSLPIVAHTNHADDAETGWNLVQKRKGKNNFRHLALQPRHLQHKTQPLPPDTKVQHSKPTSNNAGIVPLSKPKEVCSLLPNLGHEVMSTSKDDESFQTASSVVSTYNALPTKQPFGLSSNQTAFWSPNNKISASTVPIFSPRSTSRRSPATAFLLPLLNNLLIRDV